jgi:hypothetical protein
LRRILITLIPLFAVGTLLLPGCRGSTAPTPAQQPSPSPKIEQTVNETAPAPSSNITDITPIPAPSQNATSSANQTPNIVVPAPSPAPVNEVEKYARDVGIWESYVSMLGPLGNKLGSNEKTFVDVLNTLQPQSNNYTLKIPDNFIVGFIKDIGANGISDDEASVLNYPYFLKIMNPKYTTVYKHIKDKYSAVGFGTATIQMVNAASKMSDQKLAKMFIDNQFFIRDGEVDQEELEFMKDSSNVAKMFEHYLSKIKGMDIFATQQVQVYDSISNNFTTANVTTSVGAELEGLSDYKAKDINFLPAFEDMINLVKNGKLDAKYFTITVDEMLKEGIVGKRLECTPFENALWLARDYPLIYYQNSDWFPKYREYYFPYNKNKRAELADVAWWVTSTSGRYNSPRWKNLDEVAARVGISPELVEVSTRYIFSVLNPNLDRKPLTNEQHWKPEEFDKVFSKRNDNASFNAAYIATYHATVLEKNGFEAYILFGGTYGIEWANCLYKEGDKFYRVGMGGELGGPYDTPEDAAKDMCKNNAIPYGGICHVKTLDGQTVSIK